MKLKEIKRRRFKQPDDDGSHRLFININGEEIFSPDTAKALGSKLTQQYTIKQLHYGEGDFYSALKEMPDYNYHNKEKRVLIKW